METLKGSRADDFLGKRRRNPQLEELHSKEEKGKIKISNPY
jgi:hypothetical protein